MTPELVARLSRQVAARCRRYAEAARLCGYDPEDLASYCWEALLRYWRRFGDFTRCKAATVIQRAAIDQLRAWSGRFEGKGRNLRNNVHLAHDIWGNVIYTDPADACDLLRQLRNGIHLAPQVKPIVRPLSIRASGIKPIRYAGVRW